MCGDVDFDELMTHLRQRAHEPSATEVDEEEGEGSRAAVAAIVRPGPDIGEILFIRRADREGDPWSGHMAFPGGRRDAGDSSLLGTAIRETREEVGLDLQAHGQLLTRLPGIQAMTKSKALDLVVVAFVFTLKEDVVLVPNEEVAEVVWSPLGPLLRGEGRKPFPYSWQGVSYELPSFDLQGRTVWGLTHRMLELLTAAAEKA
ncbi:CoA pyrophosphatase [soil metagenome]